jgi:uncharacterized protein
MSAARSMLAVAASLLTSPAVAQSAPPAGSEIRIAAGQGALAGTLIDPDTKAPLLLIVPGSGPTDRDGNNPLGIAGGPYRQLAEALAAKGIATLRIDKRGLFGSASALADPNAVTITDYAQDVLRWVADMRARTGRRCIWVAGHSEGGLVALAAAQRPQGICGVILIAAPGRPLAAVMRAQFRANPANAPILESALHLLDALEAGRTVDTATLAPPLPRIFPAIVQRFLIDSFRYDPTALAARLHLPLLIAQGTRDVQVSVADAEALSAADRHATLAVVPDMTHVLRLAAADGMQASTATYADASLPVAPMLVDTIARFVATKR